MRKELNMESLDFSRCPALNNIPKNKLKNILDSIDNSDLEAKAKVFKQIAINRYSESNIPIEYWSLKMDRDFIGDPNLLAKYKEYIADIKQSYINGDSYCFAGSYGLGKTLTACCILKDACNKGYSCLYSNLSDLVNILTSAPNEDKFLARRELNMVDFLVIDELDPRFFSTETAGDLYARTLETIFRTRSQNKLPTLICSNSPNVIQSFTGSLKNSLDSLFKGYIKIFPVFGEDFRKKGIK